jgi:hypothetical protein
MLANLGPDVSKINELVESRWLRVESQKGEASRDMVPSFRKRVSRGWGKLHGSFSQLSTFDSQLRF